MIAVATLLYLNRHSELPFEPKRQFKFPRQQNPPGGRLRYGKLSARSLFLLNKMH